MRNKPLLMALTAVVVSIGMAGNSHANTWLQDPTTGCQVWSDGGLSDKEVPTWSGSCVDGKTTGLGVLVVHDENGLLFVYNGEMLAGKANGADALRFRNDDTNRFDRYIGSFEDHVPGRWRGGRCVG